MMIKVLCVCLTEEASSLQSEGCERSEERVVDSEMDALSETDLSGLDLLSPAAAAPRLVPPVKILLKKLLEAPMTRRGKQVPEALTLQVFCC